MLCVNGQIRFLEISIEMSSIPEVAVSQGEDRLFTRNSGSFPEFKGER